MIPAITPESVVSSASTPAVLFGGIATHSVLAEEKIGAVGGPLGQGTRSPGSHGRTPCV